MTNEPRGDAATGEAVPPTPAGAEGTAPASAQQTTFGVPLNRTDVPSDARPAMEATAPPRDDVTAPPRGAPDAAPVQRPAETPPPPEPDPAPSHVLRYATPGALYEGLPKVKSFTQHRPREGEETVAYVIRLRGTTTPEEALTFTAFAARPEMAIWWAYGCLRMMSDAMSAEDRSLMEAIAMWSGNPDNTNRWRVMRTALFAPRQTAAVHLGLAVGWSGGLPAPNDNAPVPVWRTPRAVNAAVLSSLAQCSLDQRPRVMARFVQLAVDMFRS